jgi:hypothetical protein
VIYQYELQITLFIGDGIAGTKFSSYSFTVKGNGVSETKAYIAALKQIKPGDEKFKSFINEAKEKIITYFETQCDFILKDAQSLAGQNKFDEAIYKLSEVPTVCKDCFDKCMTAVVPIFQKQIDLNCTRLMSKAQGIWSASQDEAGAKEAVEVLRGVHPQSKCFKESVSMVDYFYNEVKKRIKELDEREWKLQLKEQQDEKEIRMATIKAARDIGVAYGKGQPKTIYKVYGWW